METKHGHNQNPMYMLKKLLILIHRVFTEDRSSAQTLSTVLCVPINTADLNTQNAVA